MEKKRKKGQNNVNNEVDLHSTYNKDIISNLDQNVNNNEEQHTVTHSNIFSLVLTKI